jgi:hypothetical protein
VTKRKLDSADRIATGVEFLDALDEWQLVVRSLNRSPATIKTYSASVTQFDRHHHARQCPTTVDAVKPAHIRSYLIAVLDSTSASTAVTRWGPFWSRYVPWWTDDTK